MIFAQVSRRKFPVWPPPSPPGPPHNGRPIEFSCKDGLVEAPAFSILPAPKSPQSQAGGQRSLKGAPYSM